MHSFELAVWDNKSGAGGILTVNAGGSIVMDGGRILTRTLGDADAGILTVNANDLTLTNGAQIFAGIGNLDVGNPDGLGKGADVFVTASETISIIGTDPEAGFPSGIFSTARIGGGDAGNLTVEARELQIRDGGQVDASTLSSGEGGRVTVRANSIRLGGGNTERVTGIFATAGSFGNAGDLEIAALVLDVRDGARVSTSTTTFDSGEGGRVTVLADTIRLVGGISESLTGIFASAFPGSIGDAGDLLIATNVLDVRNGAQVSSSTLGAGEGGQVALRADNISLAGENAEGSSGIFASAFSGSTGNAGNLLIEARVLDVRDGAQVSTGTFDIGNAGDLLIQTNVLDVRNGAIIGAGTFDSGNGGDVNILAQEVFLAEEAAPGFTGITSLAGSEGSGNAGDITIMTNTLEVAGGSEISAGTLSLGNGGNATIDATNIRLVDGGRISASSTSADQEIRNNPDFGRSGNISIAATDSLAILNGGAITVETTAANAGDIDIQVGRLLLLRDQGTMTTSVAAGLGNGGDISIDPDFVILDNASQLNHYALKVHRL